MNENAARINSSCGLIYHVVGIKVYTSVYMTSFSARCLEDSGANVGDNRSNSLICSNGWMLKHQDNIERISF